MELPSFPSCPNPTELTLLIPLSVDSECAFDSPKAESLEAAMFCDGGKGLAKSSSVTHLESDGRVMESSSSFESLFSKTFTSFATVQR